MSDREFDEKILLMLRTTKDMSEDDYIRCKTCLLVLCNWSEAVHNFVVEFFKIADKSRPLLLEAH